MRATHVINMCCRHTQTHTHTYNPSSHFSSLQLINSNYSTLPVRWAGPICLCCCFFFRLLFNFCLCLSMAIKSRLIQTKNAPKKRNQGRDTLFIIKIYIDKYKSITNCIESATATIKRKSAHIRVP